MSTSTITCLAIGIVSGVIAALCGVGGGVVMVPAFVFFLKLPQKTAVATSLAIIIPTALMATTQNARSGFVDWKVAAHHRDFGLHLRLLRRWLAQNDEQRNAHAHLRHRACGLRPAHAAGGEGVSFLRSASMAQPTRQFSLLVLSIRHTTSKSSLSQPFHAAGKSGE
jgi:hypothetical protein